MKKLILLAVVLAGVGIWRGWFTFSSEPAVSGDSQKHFDLSINRDRIKADADALKEEAADLANRAGNNPK